MPFIYSDNEVGLPEEQKLRGRDLGITLDIGGRTKEQLSPQDEMAKKFGVAIQDTMQAGVNIATKLPGVEPVAKFIADSPVGWLGGKALDALNIPSWLLQQGVARFRLAVTDKNSLPADVRNMLASGANIDDVADYMYKSGRAFSNDQAANLFWQIVLDPLNFTPLALGKVNLLKTAGKAGAILGGAAVAGPVGAVVGAGVAWKGGAAARKAFNLTDKVAGMAGPTRAELGAVTTLDKITAALSKPRGLDLGTRVPAGARNLAQISKIDEELETQKAALAASPSDRIIADRIADLETQRKTTLNAMEVGKDVTNGFAIGVYNGLVGAKSSVGGGLRAVSAALSIPTTQTVSYKLGGHKFNQVMDSIASLLPPTMRQSVEEMFGRGASNIAVVAATRLLAAPDVALSRSIANVTLTQFYDAVDYLRGVAGKGGDVALSSDEIASVMIKRAKEADMGGTNRALRISDTPEGTAELVKRIDVMRSSVGEARVSAIATKPAVDNLSLHIQNELITSKLSTMGTSQNVAGEVVELLRDMGPEGVGRLVADEIDKLIYDMIPHMRSKATALEAFKVRARSIRSAVSDGTGAGLDEKLFDAQVNQQFEDLFGKFYDASGTAVGGKLDAARTNLEDAARAMVAVDMASFASSNKAIARVNEQMRMFLTEDPKKISEAIAQYGEHTFYTMQKIARRFLDTKGGGLMLVRKGYLFGPVANGLINVFEEINRLSQDARKGVSPSAEVRQVVGQEAMHTYKGTKAHVDALVESAKKMSGEAFKARDVRTFRMLKNLISELKNANDLDEARQIWKSHALKSSEDMATIFGDSSNVRDIARYLQRAVDDGFAATDLSAAERGALRTFIENSGMDRRLIGMFSGADGSGRYVPVRQPKAPYHRTSALLRNPNIDDGTKAFIYQTRVTPFVDMTAPVLDEVGNLAPRYSAGKLQELYTNLFSPIGTKQVTANIKNRLASYMARGGITPGQLDRIMDEVVKVAMDDGVSARGLARNKIEDAFFQAFQDYSGPGSFKMFKDSWAQNLAIPGSGEFDAVKAIMFAFEGNLKTVGATQKFTGALKYYMPSLARITDNLYPEIRFKRNPLYWLQEWLESPTLNKARGVNQEVLSVLTKEGRTISVSADSLRDLSNIGPEAQSIVDNVSFLTVFRNNALEKALDSSWNSKGWRDGLRKLTSGQMGERLTVAKDQANSRAALNLSAQNFYKELAERDPRLLNALITSYGTSDSTELFVRYVDMRERLRNTERVLSDIEASRPAGYGFRRIPDKNLEAMDEFKFNTVGGMNVGSEIQTSDDIFMQYINAPYESAIDLTVQADRMRDAGYDMSLLDPSIAEVKAALYHIDDLKKSRPSAASFGAGPGEEEAVQRLVAARENLSKSISKVESYYEDAVMRRVAAETIMLELGMGGAVGQLGYDAGIMAQSLALGHAYSSEIVDVTTSLQRIVENAKTQLQAEFGANVRLLKRNPAQRERLFGIIRQNASEAAKSTDLATAITNANYELLTRHGAEEKLYRAFEHVYQKSLTEANKITYFNPERSLFERTVNHPYLGFYPYSYMFKKILPELINFLFKKPFGYQAPGAGYQAYMHVREYFENQMETDYSFRKFMEDNDEAAFLITQLFPGVPWDISAMPPSYVRAVAMSMSGKDKDYRFLEDFLGRDIFGSVSKLGPATSIPSALGAGQQIVNTLTGGNQPKLDPYRIKSDKDYFDIY